MGMTTRKSISRVVSSPRARLGVRDLSLRSGYCRLRAIPCKFVGFTTKLKHYCWLGQVHGGFVDSKRVLG